MADSLDITPNQDNSLEIIRPTKKSNNLSIPDSTPTNSNLDLHGNQDNLIPHSAISVDQLQEYKQWLVDNNSQILAAMLQRLPSPVTRNITWGEFVTLFDLNFDPNEDVAKQIENVTSCFTEWVRTFNFSYMALVQATSRINSDSQKFNAGLNAIASQLDSSASQPNENFRKLFV